MAELGYADAFGRYGAKLKSVQWAVSAVAEDELVVSCWKHYFQRLKPAICLTQNSSFFTIQSNRVGLSGLAVI